MAARIQEVAASITAIGSATPWIRHDYYENPFNVTLAVFLDSAIAATLAVQYVAEDLSNISEHDVLVSQAASTTATITDSGKNIINGGPANANWGGPFGHGLITNDIVFLNGTQAGIDSGTNSYTVTVTGVTTYTCTVPVNQTITNVRARAVTGRIFPHATLVNLTARASGNYNFPVWMSRLICTAFTTPGKAFLVATQGH